MYKKVSVICFLIIFSGITVWLYLNSSSKDRFPLGSNMPSFTFRSISGVKSIAKDPNKKIMIVLFSLNCAHCKAFLADLDKNISKFKDTGIYLFAQEERIFDIMKSHTNKTYLSLGSSGNVQFGFFSLDGSRDKFKTSAVPSIFVFENNKLIKKFNGSPSINRVLN
ncbi:MAG: hypothetical protein HF314_07925 [Ignavibacteria bacterium]|jgi:thiol-disulfide isomerase/thioredoxin|nr:hypothetical protein [Ignavibacteria bacterium]MCU7517031.1 hypothetical protein [Ignavibacteria bacterium]